MHGGEIIGWEEPFLPFDESMLEPIKILGKSNYVKRNTKVTGRPARMAQKFISKKKVLKPRKKKQLGWATRNGNPARSTQTRMAQKFISKKAVLKPRKKKQLSRATRNGNPARSTRVVQGFIPKKAILRPERKKQLSRVMSFRNTVSLPQTLSQTWLSPLSQNSTAPNGLANFGASCYINSAIQILNSVPKLRESILNSTGHYSFLSGLRELLKSLNSIEGIQEDHLKKLLVGNILPALDDTERKPFTLTEPNDIRGFLVACFNVLEKIGEPTAQYFRFAILDTFHEKSDSKNHLVDNRSTFVLDLPRKLESGVQEIPGEFMQALLDFGGPQEMTGDKQCVWKGGVKIDTVRYSRIVDLPKILLMDVLLGKVERDSVVTENLRPISLPLEFNFPQEVMVDPKTIEYKLVGGIIYLKPSEKEGHFIFYLRDFDQDCFWECNDSRVQQMSNENALEILKNKGHMALYTMD
jgi:hypothetical protein